MTRKRKTRSQKIKASEKRESGQFTIKKEWLETSKVSQSVAKEIKVDKSYFRADLTKTLVLTMLVLALELALWHYLSRQ